MNELRDSTFIRQRFKPAHKLGSIEPVHINEYLATYSLPQLRRVLIALNITTANSIFPEIVNDAPKLMSFICDNIFLDKTKSPFEEIDNLVKNAESDVFSDSYVVWLKNDVEACHYFWWALVNLKWDDVFKLLKEDNVHHYSNMENKQLAVYVSDTFGLSRMVVGHKERYQSILMLLNLLPFKNEEIKNLISHLSCSYRERRDICRREVNITSLINNKESVSFSIRYLKKKNMFFSDLEPLTDIDNKSALITLFYIRSGEEGFKKLVTSLAKAWSQKQVREKRKKMDRKQPVGLPKPNEERKDAGQKQPDRFPELSEESMQMLDVLSKKNEMSHSELIDYAVLALFEQEGKFN
jgi:hypothetical protein